MKPNAAEPRTVREPRRVDQCLSRMVYQGGRELSPH